MSGRVGVEQTPDIETLAAVLAEHEDRTFDPALHGRMCWCGWGDDDLRHSDYEYHAHVAQALAPVLAAAVREARAAELREAADELTQLAVIEFDARPNAPRGAAIWDSAQWLKDRADRIAADAPEGGA